MTVEGDVQGVGFRASAAATARRLGLVGWCRNLPDGTVELFAQGRAADLDELRTFLWHGPSFARVRSCRERPAALDSNLEGFVIRS